MLFDQGVEEDKDEVLKKMKETKMEKLQERLKEYKVLDKYLKNENVVLKANAAKAIKKRENLEARHKGLCQLIASSNCPRRQTWLCYAA